MDDDFEDFEIRLYRRDADGTYHHLLGFNSKYFENAFPNVGDTIAAWYAGNPYAYYTVLSRHFIIPEHGDRGWAVVVDERFEDENLKRLKDEWIADTAAFAESEDQNDFEALEELDRENRDPAYWTHERKMILKRERDANVAAMKAEDKAAKKD